MGVGTKTIIGAKGDYDAPDLGITRHHADVAYRTLCAVQLSLRASRFKVDWRAGAHRPSDTSSARSLLVRRVWTHALLENEWMSPSMLAGICKRSTREICADAASMRRWVSASPEFRDLVADIEELVDNLIAVIAGAERFYAAGRAVARSQGLARRQTRALPPAQKMEAMPLFQIARTREEIQV